MSLLAGLVLLAGCAGTPKTAPRSPWYETESDLKIKAKILEKDTWQRHVDPSGILMYQTFPNDEGTDIDFLRSHNNADTAAWQGCLMAAYAFQEAATGEDTDEKLALLADGFLSWYRATGVSGLLGRSFIPNYSGPHLPWMELEDQDPTKYWLQGPTGEWWRNGMAKNHMNLAMFGCAIPLMLHEKGDITLEQTTKQKLIDILVPAVTRLVANDYHIVDYDGKPTEFGDLSPDIPYVGLVDINGFNMMISLHLLRSAGTYDENLMEEYERKVKSWAPKIGLSMEILGELLKDIGHYNIGKPSYSDMSAFALAGYSLLSLETRREYTKHINRGLTGLWEVVKYERNPAYNIVYASVVRNGPKELARVAATLEDWRDFPASKQFHLGSEKETDMTQPLANRKVNSHYLKDDPNERAVMPQIPVEHSYYSAQDYLLIYYMARYHSLFPER